MTENRQMPSALRWLFFAIGVGSLISCGIYLGRAIGAPVPAAGLLRALMFLLIGLFCSLMYGENKRSGKEQR